MNERELKLEKALKVALAGLEALFNLARNEKIHITATDLACIMSPIRAAIKPAKDPSQ